MKNQNDYENYISTALDKARRKRNGKSTFTAADGTLITAHKNGRVEIEEAK